MVGISLPLSFTVTTLLLSFAPSKLERYTRRRCMAESIIPTEIQQPEAMQSTASTIDLQNGSGNILGSRDSFASLLLHISLLLVIINCVDLSRHSLRTIDVALKSFMSVSARSTPVVLSRVSAHSIPAARFSLARQTARYVPFLFSPSKNTRFSAYFVSEMNLGVISSTTDQLTPLPRLRTYAESSEIDNSFTSISEMPVLSDSPSLGRSRRFATVW
mmetsp:Transcript_39403/g.82495  ORF Transcript_39403/g.82495 Transcript_39403/m.82495 type:complete len:217 (-) Transcript_39403:735-1385(-)